MSVCAARVNASTSHRHGLTAPHSATTSRYPRARAGADGRGSRADGPIRGPRSVRGTSRATPAGRTKRLPSAGGDRDRRRRWPCYGVARPLACKAPRCLVSTSKYACSPETSNGPLWICLFSKTPSPATRLACRHAMNAPAPAAFAVYVHGFRDDSVAVAGQLHRPERRPRGAGCNVGDHAHVRLRRGGRSEVQEPDLEFAVRADRVGRVGLDAVGDARARGAGAGG